MSTSFNAQIIYGFPLPKLTPQWRGTYLGWDEAGTHPRDLYAWLEDHYPSLAQHTAGEVNEVFDGAGPTYFVGIRALVATVADFVRARIPYKRINRELADVRMVADWQEPLCECASRLGCDPASVGFYLIGEAT